MSAFRTRPSADSGSMWEQTLVPLPTTPPRPRPTGWRSPTTLSRRRARCASSCARATTSVPTGPTCGSRAWTARPATRQRVATSVRPRPSTRTSTCRIRVSPWPRARVASTRPRARRTITRTWRSRARLSLCCPTARAHTSRADRRLPLHLRWLLHHCHPPLPQPVY